MDGHSDHVALERDDKRLAGIEADVRDPDPWAVASAARIASTARARTAANTLVGALAVVLVVAAVAFVGTRSARTNPLPGGGALPSSQTDASAAGALCAGPGAKLADQYGAHGSSLVASVAGSGAETREWIEKGGQPVAGNAKWKSVETAASVAFCYFDGDYAGFPQPPGANLSYSRMLVLVSDAGVAELFAVGDDSMSLSGPAAPAP